VLGWPGSSLLEFEELMEDIPLTGQSITLLGCCAPSALRLAYVVALAEKRGEDLSQVHGSVTESPFSNVFGQTDVQPFDLNMKLFLDASEYIVRSRIRMRAGLVGQHFQESGGNNAQALAIELSMLKEICGRLVSERGLDFDDVMRLPYQLVSVGTRFFEEIAKVRALRRMWARMAREHFGAKSEKSCQLLIAVHTSGRTMTYQQPLNNIVRCAIQTLAGAVAGCTAIDNAALDNAYAEPSPLAARMSLNTQHIVAVESGVADVVDPLAGSFFVERLTNEVEEAAYRILEEIDALGGLVAAIEKDRIEAMMEEESSIKFREVRNGERLIVGVNHLEGHIYASFLTNPQIDFPALALIVSGAHTDLVAMQDHGVYRVLGRTRDDAAGEAFDKVARAMGLGYPGGPQIDRLSRQGRPDAVSLPLPMPDDSWDFSFSGLKTAALRALRGREGDAQFLADLATSLQRVVVDVLVRKTMSAAKAARPRSILLVGGVAANSSLRARMQRACDEDGYRFVIPPPVLCTDNAAMIAAAGYFLLRRGVRGDLAMSAFSDLPLAPSLAKT